MPEIDRRDFLKIAGLTGAAATVAACSEPVHNIFPYVQAPDESTPGIATYYNSTCRECAGGCGIRVKTREGRPIKIDGNPDHPLSQGKLCVRGEFGHMRTYDVARFPGPMKRVTDASGAKTLSKISWEEGLGLLVDALKKAPGKAVFLGGAETGTQDAVIDQALAGIGSPHRLRFEPFAYEALRSGNQLVFGSDTVPQFKIGAADVLIAFGTDFMETWLSPLSNQMAFSEARKEGRGFAIFVGPRLSFSGANTDQWLAPNPGSESLVAIALASEVAKKKGNAPEALRALLGKYSAASVADKTGIPQATLESVAAKIAGASAPLALPPGIEVQGTNAARFAAAVQILNVVSGAVGKTVVFGPDHNLGKLARFADLSELVGKMRGGEVGVLLVHGQNPAYSAPQVGIADALRSGNVFTVSFASAPDETSELADLILPDHTAFESWGDAEPVRGIKTLQQPTVRPLFDTRATVDVLLDAGRAMGGSVPAGSFRELLVAAWGGRVAFDAALAKGGEWKEVAAAGATLASGVGSLDFDVAPLVGTAADPVLVVYPSHHLYDGRLTRVQALHEVPDPVTKTMWGSYAELSPETASALDVELGDVLKIKTEAGEVQVTAYPHETVRPGVIAVQIGRGAIPRDPNAPQDPHSYWQRQVIGVNAYSLIPAKLDPQSGALAWLSTHVSVTNTKGRAPVVRTQLTFDQEGRGFSRAVTLAELAGAEKGGGHESRGEEGEGGHALGASSNPRRVRPLPLQGNADHLLIRSYDPAADAHPDSPYRWGMNIDQDACTGCNACMAACITENNIPVVGPENIRIGREMHWLRIERYVEIADDREVDVRHTPMLCQHCGAAPCESVCPALATYHSKEGLNVMVENRCIGTRFCSNNCPYKARRFNHWSYDWYVPEPENWALNPDVMVRAKGVMEKCTFCVQRINGAKDVARKEQRTVREGEIVTACQQVCPSHAISFGNLRDKESAVTQARNVPRAYRVLEHLYTRPAISYLMNIRRTEET
ncbi:MAG TPA: 4Fe-4S dicluster domain-containing protein [Myxococcota bacterium]|nr:4Fe-4S dicluster domain-containing protein [Myxococcota bacterium]